ncbi:MAG TPA: hypothetical protein VKO20_03310 [Desulfosalsimonadaceae bacterium]|nr:hypothetical protein [Desulfosalsimonadaceae bacterium]
MTTETRENKQDRETEGIQEALRDAAPDGNLRCRKALQIAAELGLPPQEVGQWADKLGLHLMECQLGLFGHSPRKKIVTPLKTVDAALSNAIRQSLEDDRLACRSAWMIAERFGVTPMTVCAACEALEIKIKPCQLGAF